jgi:hypothetical protein
MESRQLTGFRQTDLGEQRMSAADEALIDRAINYVRELVPEALEGIQGSSEEEISAAEILPNAHFSEIHKAFLRRFGTSVGRMDFGPTDPTLAALRQRLEETAGEIPPEYELFAASGGGDDRDAYLVHSSPDTPPMVAFGYVGSHYGWMDWNSLQIGFGSISEILCYLPYVQARYNPKLLKFMLADHMPIEGSMERFQRVARDNDLSTVWFSSSLTQIVEFGDTVMIGRQAAGSPLGVSIGSSNKVEFAAAHWWLTHDVGLQAGG